eukprot:11155845-Lingulodinium_polyedra.AAC.1
MSQPTAARPSDSLCRRARITKPSCHRAAASSGNGSNTGNQRYNPARACACACIMSFNLARTFP